MSSRGLLSRLASGARQNDTVSSVTVTALRFDMASDPGWTLDTTSAVPATTWADSGNDLLWTGSQSVPPYSVVYHTSEKRVRSKRNVAAPIDFQI